MVRSHAAEFGVIAGKGAGKVVPLLSFEQGVAIPPEAKEMFAFVDSRGATADIWTTVDNFPRQ
jgi:hypothetical protein